MVKCQSALPDPQKKQRYRKPSYYNTNTFKGVALILSCYSEKSMKHSATFSLELPNGPAKREKICSMN